MLMAVSCIVNDLPYPRISPVILEMDVEDALSIDIKESEASVLIHLAEWADERNVKVRSVKFRDSITTSRPSPTGTFDMSRPVKFSLTTYDYSLIWTIRAVRDIERYFSVAGQVGESVIDDVNRRVIFYIPDNVDRRHLNVLSYKLGPEGCLYSDGLSSDTDFSECVEITVSFKGRQEVWRIFADPVEASVTLGEVHPWTRVAWLSAEGVDGEEHGFRYRRSGESQWQSVSGNAITGSGGSFSACIEGLEPETEYECCAWSGTMES